MSVATGAGFAAPVSVAMPVGESVNGWGLHDLDDDGDLDLIPATRAVSRQQLALLSVGDGTFEERRFAYTPDLVQRSVLVADFDGDGADEVAFVNRDDGGEADSVKSIVVFRNDGDLTFTELGPETGLAEYANAINAAFWSLTMYDTPNYYLVDNPIDRYSIGDRTPGLRFGDDGSITILMQTEAPEGDLAANWLPTPPGDFRPVLRMYEPGDSVLDGTYEMPPIRRVD